MAFAGKERYDHTCFGYERGGQAPAIEGVKTKPLRLIPDERGWLMEILRADEPELFTKFGQVYVSATYPGVVKAWHYHKVQVDNFACIAGMVKLVLVDTRDGSPTKGAVNEFFLGTQNLTLVQVPNLVYHGWKCISTEIVDGRQRAERAVSLRGPGRVPARAARHAALRLDAQRWLRSSSPAAPDSSAATSSATRSAPIPTGASRPSTS